MDDDNVTKRAGFHYFGTKFFVAKKRETMRPCVTQAGDTYLRGLPLTSLIGEKFDQQLTSSY